MNIQEAHEILDNYKSSSLIDINKALIRTGDLDAHQNSTSPYRTLRKDGFNQRLAGASETEIQGVRSLPLWTVVRHWKANQAADGQTESIL